MEIIELTAESVDAVAPLTADFRVALSAFRGIDSPLDIAAGRAELLEYLQKSFPVYVALEKRRPVGYLVCRVEEPCVWVESLYVSPAFRRKGIASALFQTAERLAASYGEDTVYNCIHPNNEGIIAFLKARGYTVLNLIEVRKPYGGETLHTKLNLDGKLFDY